MSDVTQILSAIQQGDSSAPERLLPLVYDELRKLAAHRMSQEQPGHTLQPTALVHEAYLRLVSGEKAQTWEGRGHFFAAAAEAMRRILVESARSKGRVKRGGDRHRVAFDGVEPAVSDPSIDLIALDEAMTQLETKRPEVASLVKLRYFAGLTLEETASALGISPATASRHWTYARAWLYRELSAGDESPTG